MREPILTDRLRLRDIVADDAALLLELDSDPEVMRYIPIVPETRVDVYRERINDVYLSWQEHPWYGIWIVEDRASGAFLGWTFIRPATSARFAAEIGWTDPREAELGFRYKREAWGRGIASEAAAPLVRLALADPATTAVVACALKTNYASVRVLEKLGLEHAGEVRLDGTAAPTVKLELRPERG